jgi:hypothetical protein
MIKGMAEGKNATLNLLTLHKEEHISLDMIL